eukprot:CAMPEP_0117468130 /NCGR_PEP_ID=MMETSP0784-20121206/6016_1 /TAXON_ID=39447 /ORGANISM="" /LENGTH=207 /DNA_ID=CAMNT_0005262127 /DNA_START=339 /DNA_END=963 /DNA_ORIENTATION=-
MARRGACAGWPRVSCRKVKKGSALSMHGAAVQISKLGAPRAQNELRALPGTRSTRHVDVRVDVSVRRVQIEQILLQREVLEAFGRPQPRVDVTWPQVGNAPPGFGVIRQVAHVPPPVLEERKTLRLRETELHGGAIACQHLRAAMLPLQRIKVVVHAFQRPPRIQRRQARRHRAHLAAKLCAVPDVPESSEGRAAHAKPDDNGCLPQ